MPNIQFYPEFINVKFWLYALMIGFLTASPSFWFHFAIPFEIIKTGPVLTKIVIYWTKSLLNFLSEACNFSFYK
jgi:hypothetical protein